MAAPIVDDELWALIEPLLPTPKPRRKKYPGRLPVAGCEPSRPERNPVRTRDRYPLARPLDKIGIWFGFNLLETVARLAEDRRVEAIQRRSLDQQMTLPTLTGC